MAYFPGAKNRLCQLAMLMLLCVHMANALRYARVEKLGCTNAVDVVGSIVYESELCEESSIALQARFCPFLSWPNQLVARTADLIRAQNSLLLCCPG